MESHKIPMPIKMLKPAFFLKLSCRLCTIVTGMKAKQISVKARKPEHDVSWLSKKNSHDSEEPFCLRSEKGHLLPVMREKLD